MILRSVLAYIFPVCVCVCVCVCMCVCVCVVIGKGGWVRRLSTVLTVETKCSSIWKCAHMCTHMVRSPLIRSQISRSSYYPLPTLFQEMEWQTRVLIASFYYRHPSDVYYTTTLYYLLIKVMYSTLQHECVGELGAWP